MADNLTEITLAFILQKDKEQPIFSIILPTSIQSNMKTIASFVCLGILSMFSCKSLLESIDAKSIQNETYLETGSYGGFTGEKTSIFLLSNGRSFDKFGAEGVLMARKSSNKKSTNLAFNLAAKTDWKNLPPPEYGNMNYFILYHSKEATYEVIWGRQGPEPPAAIKSLHDALLSALNSSK